MELASLLVDLMFCVGSFVCLFWYINTPLLFVHLLILSTTRYMREHVNVIAALAKFTHMGTCSKHA